MDSLRHECVCFFGYAFGASSSTGIEFNSLSFTARLSVSEILGLAREAAAKEERLFVACLSLTT